MTPIVVKPIVGNDVVEEGCKFTRSSFEELTYSPFILLPDCVVPLDAVVPTLADQLPEPLEAFSFFLQEYTLAKTTIAKSRIVRFFMCVQFQFWRKDIYW